MSIVYDFNNIEREKRKAEAREWIQDKTRKTFQWIEENKNLLVVVVPAVTTVITVGMKTGSKYINTHRETLLKERFCYDNSLGHYWELRRKLSNSEWLEIDRRKKNGERLADILYDLRVLK